MKARTNVKSGGEREMRDIYIYIEREERYIVRERRFKVREGDGAVSRSLKIYHVKRQRSDEEKDTIGTENTSVLTVCRLGRYTINLCRYLRTSYSSSNFKFSKTHEKLVKKTPTTIKYG